MPPMYGDAYGDENGMPLPDEMPGATTIMRLISEEEIEKFLADEGADAAVIGFFETPSHDEDLEVFKEVAKDLEPRFRFAYTTDEDIIEKNEV